MNRRKMTSLFNQDWKMVIRMKMKKVCVKSWQNNVLTWFQGILPPDQEMGLICHSQEGSSSAIYHPRDLFFSLFSFSFPARAPKSLPTTFQDVNKTAAIFHLVPRQKNLRVNAVFPPSFFSVSYPWIFRFFFLFLLTATQFYLMSFAEARSGWGTGVHNATQHNFSSL